MPAAVAQPVRGPRRPPAHCASRKTSLYSSSRRAEVDLAAGGDVARPRERARRGSGTTAPCGRPGSSPSAPSPARSPGSTSGAPGRGRSRSRLPASSSRSSPSTRTRIAPSRISKCSSWAGWKWAGGGDPRAGRRPPPRAPPASRSGSRGESWGPRLSFSDIGRWYAFPRKVRPAAGEMPPRGWLALSCERHGDTVRGRGDRLRGDGRGDRRDLRRRGRRLRRARGRGRRDRARASPWSGRSPTSAPATAPRSAASGRPTRATAASSAPAGRCRWTRPTGPGGSPT